MNRKKRNRKAENEYFRCNYYMQTHSCKCNHSYPLVFVDEKSSFYPLTLGVAFNLLAKENPTFDQIFKCCGESISIFSLFLFSFPLPFFLYPVLLLNFSSFFRIEFWLAFFPRKGQI